MSKADPGIQIKDAKPNQAVMKMIVPGRRAMGEQWVEKTIRPEADGSYSVESVEAEAPAEGRSIVLPAMANVSDEELEYILGMVAQEQEYRSRHQRAPSVEERTAMINAAWQDYMEQKLKAFKGQTTLGAGGFFQRST